MQSKEHTLESTGNRLIPSETPNLLLMTGPNTIWSNRNVAIVFRRQIYKKVRRGALTQNLYSVADCSCQVRRSAPILEFSPVQCFPSCRPSLKLSLRSNKPS